MRYNGQALAQQTYDNECDCCGRQHYEPKVKPMHWSAHWKVRAQLRAHRGRPELRYSYPLYDKRTGEPTDKRTHREPDALYNLRRLRGIITHPCANLALNAAQQEEHFITARRAYFAALAEITSPVVLP